MKEKIVKMYEALDGALFDSPSAARQHDVDTLTAGVRVVDAQVTRATARVYALWLMDEGGGVIQGKGAWHFGKCEIEQLLDLIYGHRRDGRPVDVNEMIGDIKV